MRKMDDFMTKQALNLEYSITGLGEPILIMHGGHSSCTEEWGYRELTSRGYSVITPSRPGYGKTSKELGANMITACEAYLELLDDLKITQVHVIAISAGGPSGIHFASRYPRRVRSLTLQSAVTHDWLTPGDRIYRVSQILFRPPIEKYVWQMTRFVNHLFPDYLFGKLLSSFSKLQPREVWPQISGNDKEQFKRMIDRQRSGHGFMIDLTQTSHVRRSDLSAIRCPTLIMHSVNDASVLVEHAYYAQHHIPNAKLSLLDIWGHLIWIGKGSAEMQHQLLEFLDMVGQVYICT
ncbi:alpha/beta fold hydrolase [Paenibacillus kobensis]|uniref:alpha/beta fold hydrolase n=1 Tax=Paenibacillus kobensis TaxID=59841 RepID=UPI003898E7D2